MLNSIPEDLYPSQEEEDLLYEEELIRNPLSVSRWWRYLVARTDAPFEKRRVIYERALKAFPESYKLRYDYLCECLTVVSNLPISHPHHETVNDTFERALVTMHKMPHIWIMYLNCLTDAPLEKRGVIYERAVKAVPLSYKLWYAYLCESRNSRLHYETVNDTFERALVTMHKMPRIWIMYLNSLIEQNQVTRTREVFDRALKALSVRQRGPIWELYLEFVSQKRAPIETTLSDYRRFVEIDPSRIECFIEFLVNLELWQEAAERLAGALNDYTFRSIKGKYELQLWLELCDLLVKHAQEVRGLNVDAIIRGGISKFTDGDGRLWTSFADYYIRIDLFEKARDIFEEGMTGVVAVEDFSVIFDAYLRFEVSMLALKMEEEDADLANIEKSLLERRPELSNSVLLYQNPHNVKEWHRRAKPIKNDPIKKLLTYTEAVRTVDPMKAVGKPHTLWVAFAKFYESDADIASARDTFDLAVQVNYKDVDDLARVWCKWAEMELRKKNIRGARDLMRRATAEPSVEVKRDLIRVIGDGNEPVQVKLHKSLRLWAFYVGLEKSSGSLESTRAVYERILDLGIATQGIILSYVKLLEEHEYFDDAFKVYERGVKIFILHGKDICVAYLSRFVKRYGQSKLERARELFEYAVEMAPSESLKPLYLQYANLEDKHGLTKRAMQVYDKAAKAVPSQEKMSMYEIYIARAAEIYGVPKTREIYIEAIKSDLPDKDVKAMCLKYAELEKSLGEIDRARSIYIYTSQFADPHADPEIWNKWHEFEVQHGNEDTFRVMLGLKRSVFATCIQAHFILPEYPSQKDKPNMDEAMDALKKAGIPEDEMAALEQHLPPAIENNYAPKDGARIVGFVSAGAETQAANGVAKVTANHEDIDLPENSDKVDITKEDVPLAVFGGLADKEEEGSGVVDKNGDAPRGALQRCKKQRRGIA